MSRIALVTGGTRGIGAAISIALKDAGYKVAANYAGNDESAQKFSNETGIATYKWDVSDFSACKSGVEQIKQDFGGGIEILVNNAGITRDAMLHKMTEENWHKVISTNLDSCFNTCHAVVADMRDGNFGRIINISSINALTGQMGQANYTAAKAGIISFSKSLARESASKNITVNVIAPGYIHTEMTAVIPEAIIEKIIAQIPARRFGEPQEVARCVLFLADDSAGFITGETLSVNGGHNMQ